MSFSMIAGYTKLKGYGKTYKQALESLSDCVLYNHGIQLSVDDKGYYVVTKDGRKRYAYYSKSNGVYEYHFY